MIDQKELRIGNIVGITKDALHAEGSKFESAYFEIESFEKNVVHFKGFYAGEYFKDLNPIPLTEEWLLRFGFEIYASSSVVNGWCIGENHITHDYLFDLKWMKNEDGSLAECFYKNGYFVMKYVHSLQNLYFALTGNELKLKPEL